MAGFSDYLEGKILDHVLLGLVYSPPGEVYVALHEADPGDDGIGFEFAGMSYVRKPITFSPSTSGSVSNTEAITWTNLPQGDIAWIVIHDAETDGNPLFHGALLEPKVINSGDSFTVISGAIDISLD